MNINQRLFVSLLLMMSMPLCAALHDFSRPEKVQAAVDKAFEANRGAGTETWLYNGLKTYGLVGINEEALIKHFISLKKKDIHIMDVGCAGGLWGRNIAQILQEKYKDTDTRFHILSITGGQECPEEKSEINGNIVLQQLNQFKIENIDEELIKRDFDLRNKVDLIVSNWTMRHLADPFGTVAKMYTLLNPSKGKLLTNGFLFKYENSSKTETFPGMRHDHAYILAGSNAHALFYSIKTGRDLHACLLERNDARPLELPLQYTGNIDDVSSGWQCSSLKATEFRKNENISDKLKVKILGACNAGRYYYCLEGDEKSEKLYDSLKGQGLLEERDEEDE